MKKMILILCVGLLGFVSAASASNVFGVEGNSPYLRFSLGDGKSIDFGGNYSATNSTSSSSLALMARLNLEISKYGSVGTSIGVGPFLNFNQTAASTTTIYGLNFPIIVDCFVNENLSFYSLITLITVFNTNTVGVATTYGILQGGTFGVRFYL